MPKKAADKLNMRLRNQSELIHTAAREAVKTSDGRGGTEVEFARLKLDGKPSSCVEIRVRSLLFVSELSTWSIAMDSTRNAVRTAENRPAWWTDK